MHRLCLIGVAVAASTIALALMASSAASSASATPQHHGAKRVTVTVDASAAKAVLTALSNPALTKAEAMRIAALPGNQGLIRKARSYGRPGTNDLFADALMNAARHDDAAPDPSRFRFGRVRDHAAQIRATLDQFEDPALDLLAGVKARIAQFTPSGMTGHVTGQLVLGGTSGGFAFGGPEFFLDVSRFPSAALASTIMQHELFHAVQGIARASQKSPAATASCMAKIPRGGELSQLFASLEMEGSASLVGDLTAMKSGIDAASDDARNKAMRNAELVDRSITLLELSVHSLNTGAQVSYDDIYALGFYGDEVLYGLGFVMARAIVAEEGAGAIAELTGKPGALFVQRYRNLKSYGKSDAVPLLKAETLRSAEQLSACTA
jgi:hypothetical protein